MKLDGDGVCCHFAAAAAAVFFLFRKILERVGVVCPVRRKGTLCQMVRIVFLSLFSVTFFFPVDCWRGGRGVLMIMQGGSRITMYPCIPTMPGR